MIATAVGTHLFWIASRAAGIAALLLSSVSVGMGLMMGGRFLRGRGPDLRVTHEALSMATIVAIVVHGGVLLGDAFLKLSVAEVMVPFVSAYKEPWMAMGIIAGWLMIVLGLTYYARGRIGQARWRTLHRFTAVAWLLGIAHSLGEGTDAGVAWFLVATTLVVVPAATLLIARTLGISGGPRKRQAAA
jgi:sulfoxide reductase heme-binding subunit YedZ